MILSIFSLFLSAFIAISCQHEEDTNTTADVVEQQQQQQQQQFDEHHFEWYYGTEKGTVPRWARGIKIVFIGRLVNVSVATVKLPEEPYLLKICLCNNFRNGRCVGEFRNIDKEHRLKNGRKLSPYCAYAHKLNPAVVGGQVETHFVKGSENFTKALQNRKLHRNHPEFDLICLLRNGCESEDELDENGYAFYVKITMEHKNTVRSGLWLVQYLSNYDRFEFVAETNDDNNVRLIKR